MKVLMLTPYLPYPLHSGGQVRLFNLIKNLSSQHEITLFSFIRHDQERRYQSELLKYCSKVEVFKKRKPWAFKTLLKAAFSFYPVLISMYDLPEVKQKIAEEIAKNNYDLIHVECFYVMHELPDSPAWGHLPIILVEQNVEYLVYQRFVNNFRFPILKPLMYLDVLKIKRWEKHFWRKADKLISMSEAEKKLIGIPGTEVVPNGVDSSYFSKRLYDKDKNPTVVFVGNFRWIKNVDALRYLYSEVWPKVKAELPKARLLVVGRGISKGMRDFLGSEVAIEEGIDDIREAYQRADLLLAPIRAGGGTSYKILEAMASFLPVVTTPQGIEGIKVQDKQEALVEESPEGLAKATISLLKNAKRRQEIGIRAQKSIQKLYDWQKISTELSRIWNQERKRKLKGMKD